ncbi:DUF2829 domain-containing protein [Clostridium gasigenes]|nr:DUF2829 domain-containing protein [Clostridium gasigenes]
MTFGKAVECLKDEYKVAREGWNGKGMFVYYVPAKQYPTNTKIAKKEFGEVANYNPYLAIRCVDKSVSTWVPSINDVLAEDWEVIE